jgi:hypothetical protein
MKIEEMVAAKAWAELTKTLQLLKPRVPQKQLKAKKHKLKKATLTGFERNDQALRSAVGRLKARGTVHPVAVGRPARSTTKPGNSKGL